MGCNLLTATIKSCFAVLECSFMRAYQSNLRGNRHTSKGDVVISDGSIGRLAWHFG